ncbi:MAG: DUF6797 domain-containing protein [Bacteroidota bacterium]
MRQLKPSLFVIGGYLLLIGCGTFDSGNAFQNMPDELLMPLASLPDYEENVDHKGLWSDVVSNEQAVGRGRRIYGRNCFNCHGNPDQQGSMPDSHRFWADTAKHGHDPYSMYEVLTRGFAQMPPQIRLSPREKYEVIHFIRETYFKEDRPELYEELSAAYLDSLPTGINFGPDPQVWQPWAEMDYGDFLIHTYELSAEDAPDRIISSGLSPLPNENYDSVNFAYKGIAIRLDEGEGGVAAGKAWALFDHDLMRLAGIWTGEGFIDWEGILLNDKHNIYPRTVGKVQVYSLPEPAWANPETGMFDDERFQAVDGRYFGPLPRAWTHYKGLYHYKDQVILSYSVGDANILERIDMELDGIQPIFSRTLNITPSSNPLVLRIAPLEDVAVMMKGFGGGKQRMKHGFHYLEIPANKNIRLKIFLSKYPEGLPSFVSKSADPEDLSQFTKGGPRRHRTIVKSEIIPGTSEGPFAVDVLSLPLPTPWKSRMRAGGIEVLPGTDKAVLCTIEGEVWEIGGITQAQGSLTWKRIATGLYQPLGIKVQDGSIYVGCRDQIVKLHDLNGDGEIDFYENFNSDHQLTEHYHEFAMGLQVDEKGNFYYAKSARHARTALVPQHGTLLRVSKDGSKTDILATGFRAANGVCLNPDGSFIVTDQEGHWNPMNRINWVKEGGFYGNMYGYGAPRDASDRAMEQPLMWVDEKNDRSPSELMWVESDKWGPLNGSLLNLSYGFGKIFLVLHEEVNGQKQGGMVELPLPQFPTGVMRGRFHPDDGQLYVCGMNAWGSNQVLQEGGLYRVRYTNQEMQLPIEMHIRSNGIEIRFSTKIDPASLQDLSNFQLDTWALKRSKTYGSDRYNQQQWEVKSASLSGDGQTVFLSIPQIRKAWVVEISYQLKTPNGTKVEGMIQGSIHELDGAI